jgi:hypothetical protein
MTDKETEIFTILYALGEAIRIKDWPNALPMWERLLLLHAPLAEWDLQPHVGIVLRNEATMVQMAERQSTKIH